MTHFVNAPDDVVSDAIDGLLLSSQERLTRLDGFPHIRVVLRKDWDKSKVALLTGGGSGHEPAHAGFVGKGMLTAAVCGGIYASPSVDAVLAGILAVTGSAGCLLIVKNYTGDRLNFGLAAERARTLGLKVEMVIVGDDIALPDLPQPRGVAGTLFVHKIAGALAEQGANLSAVLAAAQKICAGVKSIGVALDTCSVPGTPKQDRIPSSMMELGLGIHGEPGVQQIEFRDSSGAVAAAAEQLAVHIQDKQHVIMLNNLGGTSELEMSVIFKDVYNSSLGKNISHLIGPASLMTALDMHGFSLSIYPADSIEMELLGVGTLVRSWPGIKSIHSIETLPVPDGITPIAFEPSESQVQRALLNNCCHFMASLKDDLNDLDAKSGDGDTGTTLAGAAHALVSKLDHLPLADNTQLLRAIGQELGQIMGGSSGILLSIFFAAAGDASSAEKSSIESFKAGLLRMQEVGGAKLGDRTMVDALAPALDALHDGISEAARSARAGANQTAEITRAGVGRAVYVREAQLKGHIDPGAEAVARLFEHLADSTK